MIAAIIATGALLCRAMMAWQQGGAPKPRATGYDVPQIFISNEEARMTKTVLFYARRATDRQHEVSINAQIELGKEFISKRSWKLVGVFTDPMVGGMNDQTRPGIQALLKCASEGNIDVVLCISMDRLSRDVAHSSMVCKELLEHGVELWTIAGDAPVADVGLAIRALLSREMEDQSRCRARVAAMDDRQFISNEHSSAAP
ncbi:recombinase family protein [Rhizobiaceae bacterium n13]|uniref:Recombinase family protein n=1 Tax=Ferirhizobium litorale TaxID=2927786 RepID=A0AAE3U696_9HYPH|nr:recombinase family protein [Fererhizobium litorale]MDI7864590.1 recombinase family protein [Fererhizobium litorale]MDI7924869.1 recombinase family protein [Fererhizobium litorale]